MSSCLCSIHDKNPVPSHLVATLVQHFYLAAIVQLPTFYNFPPTVFDFTMIIDFVSVIFDNLGFTV